MPATGTADEQLRLFAAVSIPEAVKVQVEEIAERLKKGSQFTGAHPAWVRTDNLHITLVFLGNTPWGRIDSITEAMAAAVAGLLPFSLRFSGVDLFPNPKAPRVMAVGIHGAVDKLMVLQNRLASGLREREFAVEDKAYRPHLTLARIKSARGIPGLRGLVQSHARSKTEDFTVEGITLYQSRMSPKGSTYTVVKEVPFE